MEDGTEIIDITNGYAPTPAPKPTQVPESESEVDYITEEDYIREFLKPEYPTYTDLAYAYMELEDRIYNLEEEIMEVTKCFGRLNWDAVNRTETAEVR